MEHQVITALVLTERQTAPEGTRDPHRQRRNDALRERDRVLAARSRAARSRRIRAALARGIRRLAEAIEPRRPDCVTAAPDPC